jgi:hypothetical protein
VTDGFGMAWNIAQNHVVISTYSKEHFAVGGTQYVSINIIDTATGNVLYIYVLKTANGGETTTFFSSKVLRGEQLFFLGINRNDKKGTYKFTQSVSLLRLNATYSYDEGFNIATKQFDNKNVEVNPTVYEL